MYTCTHRYKYTQANINQIIQNIFMYVHTCVCKSANAERLVLEWLKGSGHTGWEISHAELIVHTYVCIY